MTYLVCQVWEDVQKSKDELFTGAAGSKRGPVGTTSKCATLVASSPTVLM